MSPRPPVEPSGVMTRKEAAHALGISPRTLSEKIAAGVIPLSPVPWSEYRVLFLRADVERVLSGQRRGVGSRLAVHATHHRPGTVAAPAQSA